MKSPAHSSLKLMAIGVLCALFAWAQPGVAAVKEKSDLNGDGIVNTADLVLFAARYLEMSFDDVDWCLVYDAIATESRVYGKPTKYFQDHYKILLGVIYDLYGCDGGGEEPSLLEVVNEPRYLARLAIDDALTGNYFVSDPVVGSVFIYDTGWNLVGELKNLGTPLGVAIDSMGYLLVANDGTDKVEIYDPATGDLLGQFGDGITKVPNAITIGPDGEIYVTDSGSHTVWVFDASYDPVPVRNIGFYGRGDGQFKFPVDAEIIFNSGSSLHELFVADQVNQRIQVFDLLGNFRRTIGPPNVVIIPEVDPPPGGWWWGCGVLPPPPGEACPPEPIATGAFNRLQGLSADSFGRLHVLDSFEAAVSVLDAVSGEQAHYYGGWGDGPGLLKVSMDVLVTAWDQAIVTDGKGNEIEFFDVPAPTP